MRVFPLLLAGLIGLSAAGSAAADNPRVEALGGPRLVLEDETTVLSLFNLKNPAAAAFLPHTNRLDLAANLAERSRLTQFNTGLPNAVDISGNTWTAILVYPSIDVLGNTLLPNTQYYRDSSTLSAGLDRWEQTGYGGLLVWLNDAWIVQIVPLAEGYSLVTSDDPTNSTSYMTGARVRAAWQLSPSLALGAEFSAVGGHSEFWQQPDWTAEFMTNSTTANNGYLRDETDLGAGLGAVWRQESVFDAKDRLDLGLHLFGRRPSATSAYRIVPLGNTTTSSALDFITTDRFDSYSLPGELQLQGLYTYAEAMDIALVTGYQNQKDFLALPQADGSTGPTYLAHDLDNIDYELSLRLRLPMARTDDLRFGLVFNNRGIGHPYPDGAWLSFDPNGIYSMPKVETVSSSIGIGTAFVPDKGSIIALEYHLGSSKSRQENTTPDPGSGFLADSGFTRFVMGVQYAVLDGMCLRLGFSDLQVNYQTVIAGFAFSKATETAALHFGVGITDDPWRLDMAVTAERVTNSPPGWTQLDKPAAIFDAGQDRDMRVRAQIGVTRVF